MFRILLAAIFLTAPLVCAVDDTLPKGGIRFKTSLRLLAADRFVNHEETSAPVILADNPADYDDRNLDMELTWGWDSRLTVVLATSYRERVLENPQGKVETRGVPGTYIGVRQRITPLGGDGRIIAETGVRLPIEADTSEGLPLESEGIDWILTTSYGQYFYPTRGGFDMDFGYRFRNGAPSNEVFFNTRLDIDLRRVAMARFSYRVTESTQSRALSYTELEYPNQQGFQILGFELERNLSRVWTLAIGYQKLLDGFSQFETSGYHLSVAWQR